MSKGSARGAKGGGRIDRPSPALLVAVWLHTRGRVPQMRALQAVMVFGRSYAEAARLTGLHRANVRRMHWRLLERLSEVARSEGLDPADLLGAAPAPDDAPGSG